MPHGAGACFAGIAQIGLTNASIAGQVQTIFTWTIVNVRRCIKKVCVMGRMGMASVKVGMALHLIGLENTRSRAAAEKECLSV